LQRTIAFSLPIRVEAAAIASVLETNGAAVTIVDLYAYQQEDQARRAITYNLSYPNPSGDLSADIINQRLQELIETVIAQFGPEGVQHR